MSTRIDSPPLFLSEGPATTQRILRKAGNAILDVHPFRRRKHSSRQYHDLIGFPNVQTNGIVIGTIAIQVTPAIKRTAGRAVELDEVLIDTDGRLRCQIVRAADKYPALPSANPDQPCEATNTCDEAKPRD